MLNKILREAIKTALFKEVETSYGDLAKAFGVNYMTVVRIAVKAGIDRRRTYRRHPKPQPETQTAPVAVTNG